MINKVADIEIRKVDKTQGVIEAFVNTMNIRDSDGDIIEPTAFDKSIANNLPIPVLLGHDQHQIVGKVFDAQSVESEGGAYRLYAKMQMNMETNAGRDAFSNVAGEYVREWSVGFNLPSGAVSTEGRGKEATRRIKELDWVETSAVVRGASPDTVTIDAKIKKANRAIVAHTTETSSGTWAASASRSALSNDIETLRGAFAWVSPDGKPDSRGSYKFIHHHAEDGKVGAANIRACSGGIGILNGGRGGSNIPKADRERVYRHLAKHIKDAGKKPPELLSSSRVWSRVRNIDTANWKELAEDLNEDEATALAVALLEEEEENIPTDANDDDPAESADAEIDDNAEDDVEETFDADAAESELIANAERQLALLVTLLENRISVQEE